jgi:hypothetical protein
MHGPGAGAGRPASLRSGSTSASYDCEASTS